MIREEGIKKIRKIADNIAIQREKGNNHKAVLLVWEIRDVMESAGIPPTGEEVKKIFAILDD